MVLTHCILLVKAGLKIALHFCFARVCVFVREIERKRKREKEKERDRQRERDRERESNVITSVNVYCNYFLMI